MTIMDLQRLLKTKLLWFSLIVLGFSLEGVALYYQYVLQELPCVVCIQFRLLVVGLIVLSTIGLFLRNSKAGRWFVMLLLLLLFIGMIDRSYQLLGTERAFFIGSCEIGLGFPDWLAIDKWIPWLFGVKTTCGYTPIIAFGVTMAEALMAMSVLLTLMALFLLYVLSKKPRGLDFRR